MGPEKFADQGLSSKNIETRRKLAEEIKKTVAERYPYVVAECERLLQTVATLRSKLGGDFDKVYTATTETEGIKAGMFAAVDVSELSRDSLLASLEKEKTDYEKRLDSSNYADLLVEQNQGDAFQSMDCAINDTEKVLAAMQK